MRPVIRLSSLIMITLTVILCAAEKISAAEPQLLIKSIDVQKNGFVPAKVVCSREEPPCRLKVTCSIPKCTLSGGVDLTKMQKGDFATVGPEEGYTGPQTVSVWASEITTPVIIDIKYQYAPKGKPLEGL